MAWAKGAFDTVRIRQKSRQPNGECLILGGLIYRPAPW